MAYAVIEMSGQQFRVEQGDSLVVDRLDEKEGAKISPKALLWADGDKTEFDGGKVKVEAVVKEHLKGEKLRIFKYRPKKRYRVTTGYRSSLTKLEITGITGPGGAKAAADKPAAKKPAAKKPAAKKPTPKKDD